ncbi:NAD(P)/FAD-dependent oxidoreductase [Tissierella carlieri]|uniref:NAD(P)/FAD-dependent oxidoreductase n=1 Tax=Tissierella carlieri TaxID=689904 RepID=A0ABT1SFK8_9FIRM|nr:NAD(P)/FAD-dependent oxidoreductase [Tissierella carlieri]MBU5313329.1 NAD(P)/FAD-dependent oxidoreductase [Tissierella carlieri]MCQ4925199.1 NAD(P)/FAD-dependent oxidoreductase [Tissierella carlieri]
MKVKRYDVVVIGGGIGGYYSARALKREGKAVAIIEKNSFGGTALRWGALPVKKVLDSFKGIKKHDHTEIKKTREYLIKKWDEDLRRLESKIKDNLLEDKIDIYFGDGEFLDSETFKLREDVIETEYFIIATGSEPASIKDIVIDGTNIITHREAIDLKNMPKSITILGGNVEGIEFAALYAEMGVEVTIIEKENNILFENDVDLVYPIEEHLKSRGVRILKGIGAKNAEVGRTGVKVLLDDGRMISSEKALVTFMRKPNFPRGIENTNIKISENKIIVNENLLTDEKNIFAIGDINGILGMAHVAVQQGLKVADYILKNISVNISYEILPRAVFTLPEMAGVGRQEWELKRDNIPYKLGTYSFKDSWRGWARSIEEGFVKIILDENNKILGIWMVGENVSEYIGLMGYLIKEEKTAEEILSNLVIHPSLTESILEALIESKDKKVIK